MTTLSSNIVEACKKYVQNRFTSELSDQYYYHNLVHTIETVEYVQEIGEMENVSPEDMEVLLLAAWFHDTGYVNTYKNHEKESVIIATNWLEEQNYPRIEEVCKCIMATDISNTAEKGLLEGILCDADLLKLGKKKKFWKGNDALRKEWEVCINNKMSDLEWHESTLTFMQKHQFFTPSVRENYNGQKQNNIKKLIDLISELKNPDIKIKKQGNYGRGVETMFRTSSRNHIQLSAIADNKANIMLSINAIIISIGVSVLVPKFDEVPQFVVPTLILLSVCVLTIIFATISTIPKINQGTFTKEDIAQKRANLLFFGNFYNMDLDEFEWGVQEMMQDTSFLYGAMTRDLYFLGKVLNKKYKYLRICYAVFMIGLVLAVSSFVIAFVIQ